MKELQLVYRILRKISDWSVSGYYSEVLVEGSENVLNLQSGVLDGEDITTLNGPVILVSTHHNEMIDIATLAMTMPRIQGERRHVSFWAKESMFKNAITGWVMRSSGAIAVKRNPNKSETGESADKEKQDKRIDDISSLFASTTRALASNKVIGVFPEGTSYTQPRIIQIMPGAARAAVEYDVWRRQNGGQDVVIVPVGIVYTAKSFYQSRLVARFGTPIVVKDYCEELYTPTSSSISANTEDDTAAIRAVTKTIALRIEKDLLEMTVNADDWETLYAASVARDVYFEKGEIPLRTWATNTQQFVNLLATPASTLSVPAADTKRTLIRYFALLHNTGLSHAVLQGLFPLRILPRSTGYPTKSVTPLTDQPFSTDREWKHYHLATLSEHISLRAPSNVLKNAVLTLAILPILPIYLPAFLMSHLVALLATPGEEEGEAQFRSVGGGIGLGIGLTFAKLIGSWIWKTRGGRISAFVLAKARSVVEVVRGSFTGFEGLRIPSVDIAGMKLGAATLFPGVANLKWDVLRNVLVQPMIRTILRGGGWLLLGWCVVKWYNLCTKRAHRTYTYTFAPPARRLWMHHLFILLGFRNSFNPRSISDLFQDPDLSPYLTLPPPPTNAFIRKREQVQVQPDNSNSNSAATAEINSNSRRQRPIPTAKLLMALLCAREEARQAVCLLIDNDEAPVEKMP
ncbi:hypothetical protein C8R42DRAFT_653330 [Lentinula raphanica]|nr:hypothetical protein C8R42DRAFT_653330 [Lentinula raphanica]